MASFAKLPVFEPANQQEAYEMAREGLSFSEQVGLPVLLRITTRLAHSRANVSHAGSFDHGEIPPAKPQPPVAEWTLVPSNARKRFRHLLEMQSLLVKASERSPHNSLQLCGKRGIIAAGIGYNYVREALGDEVRDSLLKISTYPLPLDKLRQLVEHCDEIILIEEGYPYIESRLNGLLGLSGKTIRGRLTGALPQDGELTPENVGRALGVDLPSAAPAEGKLAVRAPQLCRGCPHADTFKALVESVAGTDGAGLFSDIGCYTLGALPPFNAVHSCVDMGASISMAHGASRAGMHPVLCTIGDSTFTHSGMTPLLGAARSDANITVLILDNATVAMTGAQDTLATGEQLVALIKGLGVQDVEVFEPHPRFHKENVERVQRAINHRGLSVLVARRACIQIKKPVKPVERTSTTCGGCGNDVAAAPDSAIAS
jgi:indolepyruvate ferredoxin oxidoreductase alpha subunit